MTLGFAGEYPWATPFNTEPDEWYGAGGNGEDFPVPFLPAYHQLAIEWEYDASLSRYFTMTLPARPFFSSNDLWWNDRDGYRLIDGRTVFCDPAMKEGGKSALLADNDDLLERLNKLDLEVI